jgi:uncharacterized protein YbjT (DUF2867 family)
VVAETLRQRWTGKRIIELEGPRAYSPNDVAAALGSLFGRPVAAAILPRAQWTAVYQSFGASPAAVAAMTEMIDAFNGGRIDFERQGAEHIIGRVPIEEALRGAAQRTARA